MNTKDSKCQLFLYSCISDHLWYVFENCIASYKQPQSMLKLLASAESNSTWRVIIKQKQKLFKWMDKRCDLFKLNYVQPSNSFNPTSHGRFWATPYMGGGHFVPPLFFKYVLIMLKIWNFQRWCIIVKWGCLHKIRTMISVFWELWRHKCLKQ